MAKDVINEPFAVINADDYYGKEAFKKVHDYLVNDMDGEAYPLDLCMAAFELINTVWPAAIAHSTLNAAAGFWIIFTPNAASHSTALVSVVGIAG